MEVYDSSHRRLKAGRLLTRQMHCKFAGPVLLGHCEWGMRMDKRRPRVVSLPVRPYAFWGLQRPCSTTQGILVRPVWPDNAPTLTPMTCHGYYWVGLQRTCADKSPEIDKSLEWGWWREY